MTEHPIIFNGEMVRAILDGRKTMTRRPVKRKLALILNEIEKVNGKVAMSCLDFDITPPCAPGDHLWVREACYICGADCDGAPLMDPPVIYAADGATKSDHYQHVRPSIHMPRWASRITMEVESVRVERVQDITEEDAIREGIDARPQRAKDWFVARWDEIYGNGAWDRNEWVWVIGFRRIQP